MAYATDLKQAGANIYSKDLKPAPAAIPKDNVYKAYAYVASPSGGTSSPAGTTQNAYVAAYAPTAPASVQHQPTSLEASLAGCNNDDEDWATHFYAPVSCC